MISLKNTRRPIYRAGLGQLSSFLYPPIGETTTATTPTASTPQAEDGGIPKPIAVLSGVALTALSAATAYVGISYGMDRKNTDIQRALGWTVGVIGAMSGLVRAVGTTVLALIPSKNFA